MKFIQNKLKFSDLILFISTAAVIIIMTFIACSSFIVGYWYYQSTLPILEFKNNPGINDFDVLGVTPGNVEVRWNGLSLLLECPGDTTIALLGALYSANIETYPLLLDTHTKTFVRNYTIPPNLPEGDYIIKITDIVRCNPLFETQQILRVPFTLHKQHEHNLIKK